MLVQRSTFLKRGESAWILAFARMTRPAGVGLAVIQTYGGILWDAGSLAGDKPARYRSPLPTPLDSRFRGNDGACPAFREARIFVPRLGYRCSRLMEVEKVAPLLPFHEAPRRAGLVGEPGPCVLLPAWKSRHNRGVSVVSQGLDMNGLAVYSSI